MEIGLYTFGDVGIDPASGRRIGPAERLRNLVEEIALADQVGLDVFGLGEHHRPDYAVSAPAVVLAAAAARTERIRLTSAVTVLSSDDPVRVFQQFATLDNLSRTAGPRSWPGAARSSSPSRSSATTSTTTTRCSPRSSTLLLRCDDGERITWPGGDHTAGDRRPRRLSAARAGPAADLDRGRRHAAVGGPRRHARPAAGAGDHRRRAGALRAALRPLPRGGDAGRTRPGSARHLDQRARLRRRDQRSRRPTSSTRPRPR